MTDCFGLWIKTFPTVARVNSANRVRGHTFHWQVWGPIFSLVCNKVLWNFAYLLKKFGKLNCSLEVVFCLYEKYEILLILRDIFDISYFHEFATIIVREVYLLTVGTIKRAVSAYVFWLNEKVPQSVTSSYQNSPESNWCVLAYQIPKIALNGHVSMHSPKGWFTKSNVTRVDLLIIHFWTQNRVQHTNCF